LQWRDNFAQGRAKLRIEEITFRLRDYHAFLREIAPEAEACKRRQQAAFEAERERWTAAGLDVVAPEAEAAPVVENELPPGTLAARAPLPANVWQVLVRPGERIEAGAKLVILEAMKMEIPVTATASGIVQEILCAPGQLVSPGQALCLIKT
jgi:urea carboxylase